VKPLTIKQALAWRKPAGALSWVEPQLAYDEHTGIEWVIWTWTDGATWIMWDRVMVQQDSISPTKDGLSGFDAA